MSALRHVTRSTPAAAAADGGDDDDDANYRHLR